MCICPNLEIRGAAFRHVCKSCYQAVKKNSSPLCIADCSRLETNTPFYAVCVHCYEIHHEKTHLIEAIKETVVEPVKEKSGEVLAIKLKKIAKKA